MSTETPPPRSQLEALQILATEHWSLLATRALTYQESLGRVNMFLGILSGAVIALALVAQADHFGAVFVSVAIFMPPVVVVPAGFVFFVVTAGLIFVWGRRSVRRLDPALAARFPTQSKEL